MSALVFGASAQIGHFLLPQLAACGEPVWALSRRLRTDTAGVRWLHGALSDALPPPTPVDAIFSLGPLSCFVDWLQRVDLGGHPRVVAMSSMSAESKRDAPLAAEREMAERLRMAEAQLAEICHRRSLHWTVLRSTLIYGAGSDRSLTPVAQRALRWRVFPLPSGRGLRQPVHAQDLALAVQAAVSSEGAKNCVLEVGGGERLTARQMFVRVRAGLPRWTFPVSVPRPLLWLAGRLHPVVRGPVARLDQDLLADNHKLEALLGVRPRDFRP